MNERKDKNKIEEQRRYEKYVRWQETRVTQFGYVNYLILTLASGATIFVAAPLTKSAADGTDAFYMSCLYESILLCFLISILFGVFCACCRLLDFRGTAKITKMEHRGKHIDCNSCCLTPVNVLLASVLFLWFGEKDNANLRQKIKILGKTSWCLLRIQVLSFILAILLGGWWAVAILFNSNVKPSI